MASAKYIWADAIIVGPSSSYECVSWETTNEPNHESGENHDWKLATFISWSLSEFLSYTIFVIFIVKLMQCTSCIYKKFLKIYNILPDNIQIVWACHFHQLQIPHNNNNYYKYHTYICTNMCFIIFLCYKMTNILFVVQFYIDYYIFAVVRSYEPRPVTADVMPSFH